MTDPIYIATYIAHDRSTLMTTFRTREEAEEYVKKSVKINPDPVFGCWATITELKPVKWDDNRLDSENVWMKAVNTN